MNISQTNSTPQSLQKPEPGCMDVESFIDGGFEAQLIHAAQDTKWFTGNSERVDKERENREVTEEKRQREKRVDDSNEDQISLAINSSQTQIKSTTTAIKEELSQQKELDQHSIEENSRLNRNHNQSVTKKNYQKKISTGTEQGQPLSPDNAPERSEGGKSMASSRFNELLLESREMLNHLASGTGDGIKLRQAEGVANLIPRDQSPPAKPNTQKIAPESTTSSTINKTSSSSQTSLQNRFSNLGHGVKGEEKPQISRSTKHTSGKGDTFLENLQSVSGKKSQSIDGSPSPKSLSRSAEQNNIREILGNVRVLLSSGRDEIMVKLAPEHLGKLEIKLKKMGEKTTGQFTVESKEAKDMLEKRFTELQEGLKEQGIKIEEFSIIIREENSAGSSFASNGEGSPQSETHSPRSASVGIKREHVESVAPSIIQTDSEVSIYA